MSFFWWGGGGGLKLGFHVGVKNRFRSGWIVEVRAKVGKLRPRGHMWPVELFNPASKAFKVRIPSPSILACPLKKAGPNIIWSYIFHL